MFNCEVVHLDKCIPRKHVVFARSLSHCHPERSASGISSCTLNLSAKSKGPDNVSFAIRTRGVLPKIFPAPSIQDSCRAAPPRGRPFGPPYRVAAAQEKETPGRCARVSGVLPLAMPTYALVAFPVEERLFQGRNLHTLGADIFAEKLYAPVPPGTDDSSPVTFPRRACALRNKRRVTE